jgi:predicted acyl esterase
VGRRGWWPIAGVRAALRLHVQFQRADDISLFAGVRKFRGGRQVVFEGSYSFIHDMVTHGMQKASLRRLDTARSEPWRPVHPFSDPEPLRNGEVVPVEEDMTRGCWCRCRPNPPAPFPRREGGAYSDLVG